MKQALQGEFVWGFWAHAYAYIMIVDMHILIYEALFIIYSL